jgi:predicted dehydrogenase
VVGVGSIGERHLRCFQASGRAHVGLVELNDTLRQSVAQRYNVADAFSSLDDALKQSWDAAVVAAPAHVHIPIGKQLAQAGVHMLMEKPLSTTLDGVAELAKLVEQRKLTLSVAYVHRSHPGLTAMREALLSGRFGMPKHVTVVAGQNFPFYRPGYQQTYYRDRKLGGGAIQDALTHSLNACEWLVGPITRISADAAHQVLEGVEVEDTVNVIARHGAVLASYSLNQFQAQDELSITVSCDGGSVRAEYHAGRWRWIAGPGDVWHDEVWPKMERDEWFIRQANHFLNAVECKEPVLCSLAEGVQTLQVNLAVLDSALKGGQPISIPQPA